MTTPQLIDSDILCLAHTDKKLEWCDRRETCHRALAIRDQSPGNGYGIMLRVCQPGAHDQFIEAK